MDLLALVRKDALAVRRNVGLYLLLLVVLPGALVMGTVVYQQTIPRDVPVGVVPADETTTQTDVAYTSAGLTFFSSPKQYETREEAVHALQREQVYLVVEVPGGIDEAGNRANFTVISDDSLAPFQQPANFSVAVMDSRLDYYLDADVEVAHERIDRQRGLSEYLVPSTLLFFVVLYGLVFVPEQVRRERLVLDRLQTESRLETVVASKLLVYGALLLVPLATAEVLTTLLGYDMAHFRPFTLLVLVLTFCYLAATGLAVQFAFRLRDVATYANLGVLVGVLGTSSIVYPVGFFSPARKQIARAMPSHYSMIGLRSGMLKDAPMSLYADYLGYVVATLVAALVALELAIVAYRRRR